MTLKPFFQQRIVEAERRAALANMTRQQQFDHGYITVSDLDDEELRAGKCRDEFGKIPRTQGKTDPIPRDLYDEMVAEHEARFNTRLRDQLDFMIDVMVDIAKDETVEPRDRLEAAKYIFERTAGKTPDKIAVTVSKAPWEQMLMGIAKVTRAESQAMRALPDSQLPAIDAEVVGVQPDSDCPQDKQTDTASQHGPTSPNTHPPGHFADVNTQPTGEIALQPTKAPQDTAEMPMPGPAHWYTEHVGYAPATEAPSFQNVANSSSTMPRPNQPSAHLPTDMQPQPLSLADAMAEADALSGRRKDARRKIKAAKARRMALRKEGVDAMNKAADGRTITATEVPIEGTDTVQIRFDFDEQPSNPA